MNIYGKIADYFIANKKLSLLIVLGIALWGSLSFILMPKQYNPDIVAPAFQIDVAFPGATVDEVYQIVTKPLEDVLHEMPEVENIYSTSVQGGMASVVVAFYVGENLEKSIITLRQKISSRLDLKPLGVGETSIRSLDPEDLPIKTYALSSATLDARALRNRAYQFKDALRDINDVSIINVIGGRKTEFQIVLDPEKMKTTKTSLQEIEKALSHTALLRDLGLVKTRDRYFHIETHENVATIQDIEDIIIIANVEYQLKVRDVARVIKSSAEFSDYVGFYKNGAPEKNAVFVSISKQKGKNIIQVGKELDTKVHALKSGSSLLDDITVDIVKDEARVAQEQVYSLAINLLEAIGIVFIVLLCFLNYRAAAIVAISIPLTLLTVFGIGNLCGYTINRITLFALILSLGLLVDSATVVVENIVRHKKLTPHAPRQQLMAKAVSEIGVGLFLSTATTVVAFIPMSFITGMMGPYMGPLPFFVSMALIVSLIFAYTLNPWLAYHFCRDEAESPLTKHCGVLCRANNSIMAGYTKMLSALLYKRGKRIAFLSLCFITLLVVLTFPVLHLVRFRMLPKADREQMFVYIDLDRGTSIERSQTVAEQVARRLSQEADMISVQSFVGTPPILDFNGLFKGVSERQNTYHITLKVNLTHPKTRKKLSENIAVECRRITAEALHDYPEARVKIIEDPPGPPVKSTFHVKIKGNDPALLHDVARDLEQKIHAIKEVKDIDTSMLEQNDKFEITIDKTEAARAKVSVDSISRQIETLFTGSVIGIYHSDYYYEQEYITLTYDRALRDDISDLDDVFIINDMGNHVPLSRFVTMRKTDEQDTILNDNRERTIYISGEMGKRSVTYACIDLLNIMYRYSLSGHTGTREHINLLQADYVFDQNKHIKIEIGGEWELTVKVFRDLGMAMACAIVVIYLLLVAQFKSFLIPLLILITIPLAMIGVMPGFAVLFAVGGIYFSATSMIGVIALAGIVVNNAIIFIEHIMQNAKQFDRFEESLLDAGVTRMRPIVLTSVTTILGSLVIASDPVWAGLAWAIVFGLSLSTGLTLFVFPALIFECLGQKWFAAQGQTNTPA